MEIIIIGIYSLLNDEHIKNYLKQVENSETVKYEFVNPVNCETGPRNGTYVFAPIGKVFLKQVSINGNVGKICE